MTGQQDQFFCGLFFSVSGMKINLLMVAWSPAST